MFAELLTSCLCRGYCLCLVLLLHCGVCVSWISPFQEKKKKKEPCRLHMTRYMVHRDSIYYHSFISSMRLLLSDIHCLTCNRNELLLDKPSLTYSFNRLFK